LARHAYQQQDLQRDLDAITATGVPGVLAEVRTGGGELRGTRYWPPNTASSTT